MTSPAPLYHYRYPYHPATLYLLPKPVALLPARSAVLPCLQCYDTGYIAPYAGGNTTSYLCDCEMGDMQAWAELEDEWEADRAFLVSMSREMGR